MRPAAPPVPVVSIGAISTTSTVWRWRGALHVTVVAKATFALQHRTWMAPIVAEPIEDDEIVPYRSATDVVIAAAHAYSYRPTEATAVRLVLRGRESQIDKSLLVYAPRPGGVVAPFQKAAIVKRHGRPQALVVDPKKPSSRGTFGRIETSLGTLGDGGDGVLIVDDDVDWTSFQVAPADQRVPRFVGDEWLILEGMTPDRPRFESRLPGAVVETRIYAKDLWCGRSLLLSMVPGLFSIDIDNHKCSLVWRGSFTVDSLETASGIRLVSALHMPGGMTRWPTVHEIAESLAIEAHQERMTALADTDRESAPERADLTARALRQARAADFGPLASLPVEISSQGPVAGSTDPSKTVAAETVEDDARMVVHRRGVVMLRPNDRNELSVTDTGTLDLLPDRTQLAPPITTPITLCDVEGAPWTQDDASWVHDAARRGAGGTLIASEDDFPPELDDQDVDTLERTLSDSLDEMQGDAIAELFDVERFKKP